MKTCDLNDKKKKNMKKLNEQGKKIHMHFV